MFITRAVTVEDQLADLTELLKSALDEEENHHAEAMVECVDIKNPGKIDANRMEDIKTTFEAMARKVKCIAFSFCGKPF